MFKYMTPVSSTNHRLFKPYTHSPLFRGIYQRNMQGVLVNRFSLSEKAVFNELFRGRPLRVHFGGADLSPQELAEGTDDLLINVDNTPVYLMMHHSLAGYAWNEGIVFGKIKPKFTLVHFDAHADMHQFDTLINDYANPDMLLMEEIFRYSSGPALSILFIWGLVAADLISSIYWFSSPPDNDLDDLNMHREQSLRYAFPNLPITILNPDEVNKFDIRRFGNLHRKRLVLDIDCDYFKHLNAAHSLDAALLIKQIFNQSGLATISLSPIEIDIHTSSQIAVDLLKLIGS